MRCPAESAAIVETLLTSEKLAKLPSKRTLTPMSGSEEDRSQKASSMSSPGGSTPRDRISAATSVFSDVPPSVDETLHASLEDTIRLFAKGGFAEQLLSDVLDETGGRNATSVTPSSLKSLGSGDGAVARPPVDFRRRWRLPTTNQPTPSDASWIAPVLQELEIPWDRHRGRLDIEVWDRDVRNGDEFLGRACLSLADVFRHGFLDRWVPLERATSDADPTVAKKKNRTIDAIVGGDNDNLGKLRVCVRSRVLGPCVATDVPLVQEEKVPEEPLPKKTRLLGTTSEKKKRFRVSEQSPPLTPIIESPYMLTRRLRDDLHDDDLDDDDEVKMESVLEQKDDDVGSGRKEVVTTGVAGAASHWRQAQAVCAAMLEPRVHFDQGGKRSGYVGQYKDVARSLKYVQDTLLWIATILERIAALCTWVHPHKTLFVLGILGLAIIFLCIVPNGVVVAAVCTKMFTRGFAKRLRGIDASQVVDVDKTEQQLKNILTSLPNAHQRHLASRHKRGVFAAQFQRQEDRVRLGLHYSFRIKCQLHALIIAKTGLDHVEGDVLYTVDEDDDDGPSSPRDQEMPFGGVPLRLSEVQDHPFLHHRPRTSVVSNRRRPFRRTWTPSYAAVADGHLMVWLSLKDAADKKRPIASFVIAGPARTGAVPRSWPVLPSAFALTAVPVRANAVIRDFFLGIHPSMASSFSHAINDDFNTHLGKHRQRHDHHHHIT